MFGIKRKNRSGRRGVAVEASVEERDAAQGGSDSIAGQLVSVRKRPDSGVSLGLEVTEGEHKGRWLSLHRHGEFSDEWMRSIRAGETVRGRVQKNTEPFMTIREEVV